MTRTMKMTFALFLVACLQSLAAGYGQKVTLSEKDAKIDKVFKEIRRQTGFQFLYTTKMVENAKKVTIDVKNVELEDVLNKCFEEQPFTYEIRNKTIILKSKPEPVKSAAPQQDPPIDIKGRLLNDKGEPIAGASVTVKGTLVRVLTNTLGEFSLVGVEDNAILYISHVQYEDAVIPVNGNPQINATLLTRVNSLDELQVIAYGTVTKRLNSGNVYTVKARDLAKQPVSNPLQAIQGRVPGVMVVQETGVPGGSYNVVIRGRNSIINGNDPLYIIDGVPYASQVVPFASNNTPGLSSSLGSGFIASSASIGGNRTPSPLNYLNVNDIESIDVLKDADATAIYGSRGANGVILITTKKGKAGKTNVDLNVYTGVAAVANKMKMMNNDQFVEYRQEAFTNDKNIPSLPPLGPTDSDINGDWDKTINRDWQDILWGGNASYTDAQAAVSGGSADVQYMVNGGYHKETTVYPGDFNNKRGSLHFTLNTSSQNKKLKVQLSGGYVTSYNYLPSSDLSDGIKYYPISPELYDENGNVNWAMSTIWNNPVPSWLKYSKVRTKNLLGNVTVSYEIIPGLEVKTMAGYSDIQFNDLFTTPTTAIRPNAAVLTGSTDFSWNATKSWIVEPQLQYKFQISDAKFEVLVGSTIHQNKQEGMRISGAGYTDNSLLENLAGAATVSKGNVYNALYKYNAGFARIKYNWQDKYIIHLTGRRDGSSRFGPGNRFNNFGAAGVAWLFSNEDFISRSLPLLSFGKIRLSYGTTGNDQIGDYRFIDTYTGIGGSGYANPYQNSVAFYPDNLYNGELAWEVNKKAEAGLEIGLARDRFFLSASYFRNRSSNQLVSAPLPDITGFTSININLPALVQNEGWEFMFRTFNIKTKDFSWVSNFNFTMQDNKLVEFPNLEKSTYANRLVIGQPITVQQLYNYSGVNPSTGAYSFINSKGDSTSNPVTSSNIDKYVQLNIDPEFFGGFQNTFTYKNFELDVFLQFVKQLQRNPAFLYSSSQPGLFARGASLSWPEEILNNRWQKPGDIATYQRYTRATSGDAVTGYAAAYNSRVAWVDASFVRIKNASLSYRLPETWVRQMHMQSVRVYVQGQNLFTFTKYKGLDPETGMLAFPPLRVLTGGIQVTL